jgi:hypothetical protein
VAIRQTALEQLSNKLRQGGSSRLATPRPEALPKESGESKWLDSLGDWYKQILSLSSGFVGVTVTFGDQLMTTPLVIARVSIVAAWLMFGGAVILSLQGLSAVAHLRRADTAEAIEIAKSLSSNAGLAWIFTLGVWLTALAGVSNVF